MKYEISVHRRTPLPVADLRGSYTVTGRVIAITVRGLADVARRGRRDGGHEGLVFWAGLERADGADFTAAIVPETQHSYGRVIASREAVGAAAREARSLNLGLLAQVHSHPGTDTRHSDGDDQLVLMPFEGMLSLVAPNFGVGVRSLHDFSVHQYQGRRWVLCRPESVRTNLSVVHLAMDPR